MCAGRDALFMLLFMLFISRYTRCSSGVVVQPQPAAKPTQPPPHPKDRENRRGKRQKIHGLK